MTATRATIECALCGEHHPTDDVDPCPGDCNRAWIAAERAAFNEMVWVKTKRIRPDFSVLNHDVPMIEAAPVWCRPCQDSIYDAIAAFPAQCAPLTPGPLNIPRATTGGRSASITPPSPSPAWDQADEIIRWAVNTEDMLRAHIGDHGRGGQRPWRDLGSAVAYLTLHITALLSCPDAVAVGFEALRMHRRLIQVTGVDKLVHRLPGTCMVCKRRSLQRTDGDDLVKCRACGATWDVEYYNFLARASADAVRAS